MTDDSKNGLIDALETILEGYNSFDVDTTGDEEFMLVSGKYGAASFKYEPADTLVARVLSTIRDRESALHN